jgi:MFS transporter, Spinster family, sphingosine-1-phosphate transporter
MKRPAALNALILLSALNLLNYLDRYILPGVQPLIQKEFQVNDEHMGALTYAFFITYMIAAPLTGWLGDNFPRKPLLVISTLIWSLATLSTAWVHDYNTLYFRHAVVGIGEASFCIFAPSLLADYYPETERNRVLSFFYLAIPVGSALGYLAGGILGSHYGWRTPFFLASFPGVVIAILLFFFVHEPKRGGADRLVPTVDRSTVLGLARNPAYLSATLGMAMLVFAMGGLSVWMPTFFYRYGGYSLSKANLLLGGITVIDGIVGTWVGGWIAQRWLKHDHRALYLVSAWSALLAIPFGAMAFFGPRAFLLPSVLLAEFCLFLNTGPLNAAIVNSAAASVRATAIAVNLFLIHALGDAPSPRIIGRISDHSNLRLGMGVTLGSLVVSALILFAGSRFAPRLVESELTSGVVKS